MRWMTGVLAAAVCATAVAQENLRGFGRVEVEREIFGREGFGEGQSPSPIVCMRFHCETPENAETVAGKFLTDLHAEDGVAFKDGIHTTPGGASFAVERDGTRTVIYGAESRAALEELFTNHNCHNCPQIANTNSNSQLTTYNSQLSKNLVASAAVPEWMRAFHWGVYGIGGLENTHNWMGKAKRHAGIDPKADKTLLDPRDDFAFLREMGPIHFDNWLQMQEMDNSDGILSPIIYSRRKLAADFGIPFGVRLYMPNNGTSSYNWFSRRFASRMEKPAPWMQCGWLRYYNHMPHVSWFDEDIWGYAAARTKDAMTRLDPDGKARTWMHPAGELAHQTWYDWHADYSRMATNSWHAYLKGKGVSLEEAAAMFNHPDTPFASWDEVPVPEFAHFAGLSGMVLDLYGTWQTASTNADAVWTELPDFPGNWDFLSLYGGADEAQKVAKTAERRFRRTFEWSPERLVEVAGVAPATNPAGGRVWLYFFPMLHPNTRLRHDVSLNGGDPVKVGQWCALDVTDQLREGENTLDILLRGTCWNGRVFLSTEKPEVYPNMAEARCRLWDLWHNWRRDIRVDRCEMIFDAMRQVDPNTPIEVMAPTTLGMRRINRLMREWGGFSQFTGEGTWFFPWWKRHAKLYGYQGTSETSAPLETVEENQRSTLRVFLAGLDMHKPVFLAQTYSRNPSLREWWLSHKGLFARIGTYDIDLSQPQVLIYRRYDLLGTTTYPMPFPVVDEAIKELRVPWNYDIGRGELQSLGQSPLYLDDDGVEDNKMAGFKVMFDCGNELIPEEEVARIKAWVEKGGVFIAYPFTGRSTLTKADSWPMAALTGSKIKENAVRPGYVPKIVFPDIASGSGAAPQPQFDIRNSSLPPSGGSSLSQAATPIVTFPSFAGQTLYGAKRRLWEDDFALETVADDAEPILFWEDGRIAATARRVGKGLAIHLGSMFWRGTEDVNGIWKPQDKIVCPFLRDLLAAVGHAPALVETDDRLVLAQPYRSHNGLDLVAAICNFNEDAEEEAAKTARETTVKLRTGGKPRRIVAFAGVGCGEGQGPSPVVCPFDWDEAAGTATVRIALPQQEVAVLNAECYGVGEALDYWWRNSAEQWHELKKPTRDFSKYSQGEWRDPAQDLKEGWEISDCNREHSNAIENIPLDCLQFWGWPDCKGALCVKTFDLADPSWSGSGAAPQLQFDICNSSLPPSGGSSLPRAATRLVAGALGMSDPNFFTPATIRLNGSNLVERTSKKYLDIDVTSLLKPTGNVLEIELADASDGGKFTGMDGSIYLYRREAPEVSIAAQPRGDGKHDFFELFAPQEWLGRYRVRLYMEGTRDVPRGVRVRDRFMRRHHHNLGDITDIDITDLLRFGETNRIDIGANSPAELPDKTSAKTLTTLRIDLYPQP